MNTTHYANYVEQVRTPTETVLSFSHKEVSEPIRIAMTHDTFEALKDLINREESQSTDQPETQE